MTHHINKTKHKKPKKLTNRSQKQIDISIVPSWESWRKRTTPVSLDDKEKLIHLC